jgi:hypothetical protein
MKNQLVADGRRRSFRAKKKLTSESIERNMLPNWQTRDRKKKQIFASGWSRNF